MIRAVKQYQRKLAKHLRCCRDTKEALLAPFHQSLEAYLEVTPEPSLAQLHAAFGKPEAMAAQMMECVSKEEAERYRKHQRAKKIAVGILLAAVLAFALYVFFIKENANITIISSY